VKGLSGPNRTGGCNALLSRHLRLAVGSLERRMPILNAGLISFRIVVGGQSLPLWRNIGFVSHGSEKCF
jgi:hypothetical protein